MPYANRTGLSSRHLQGHDDLPIGERSVRCHRCNTIFSTSCDSDKEICGPCETKIAMEIQQAQLKKQMEDFEYEMNKQREATQKMIEQEEKLVAATEAAAEKERQQRIANERWRRMSAGYFYYGPGSGR